jgi:hypothetical protein
VSFNSLRNRIFLVSSFGIIAGGFLGAQLGSLADAGWGDLVGAIVGMWLGGPISAMLTFQILIGKLDFELALSRARVFNVILTLLTATILLTVFSVAVRISSGSILLVFILIFANLLLNYLSLVATLRLAKK